MDKKKVTTVPEIVQQNTAVLRGIASDVPVADITSSRVQKIIENMKFALASQDDGVAIAAPQISVPLRIFVVSKKVNFITKGNELETEEEMKKYQDTIYINPVITRLSRQKKTVDEGCLSVRYLYGKVKRSEKATVTAYNENGEKFTKGASGLLAQIFQHEIDHLDGILFIDKATDVAEVLPQNNVEHRT